MRVTHIKPSHFFSTHGFLATLRNYPYVSGQNIIVKTWIGFTKPDRTKARVLMVIENYSDEDLEKYTCISGFKTKEEWLEAARELHSKKPKRLVVVAKRNIPLNAVLDFIHRNQHK